MTDHYAARDLLTSIEAGLAAMGASPSTVTMEDLGAVDEFHVGGRSATAELCEHLGVDSREQLLDVGCGIGGTARFVAATTGCHVTGLDLTAEYVEVARTLSEWTALDHLVRFEVGSALDMPFADSSFDGATQLHVGMNISDKRELFAEVHRVLRPGGRFALYDIVRLSRGEIGFPVPWASDPSTSFVDDLPSYRRALDEAGFQVEQERDRGDRALGFFAELARRIAQQGGPAPLGLHLLMGSEAPQKIANMVEAVEAGTLAPVELICRRRDP